VNWRKSSYSNSGACTEAADWRSACESGACVEAAACACPGVLVRDSQDQDGPVLAFTAPAWAAFTAALKARR